MEHGVIVAEDAEGIDERAVSNGGGRRDGIVQRGAQPQPGSSPMCPGPL